MCSDLNHRLHRYQYKGFWIDISLAADWENGRILYAAAIELPNKEGVVHDYPKETRQESEFSAEEIIDSWN